MKTLVELLLALLTVIVIGALFVAIPLVGTFFAIITTVVVIVFLIKSYRDELIDDDSDPPTT